MILADKVVFIVFKTSLLLICLREQSQGQLRLTATPSTLPRNANALGGRGGGSRGHGRDQGEGQNQGQGRSTLELVCSVEEPKEGPGAALPDLKTITRLGITYADEISSRGAEEKELKYASFIAPHTPVGAKRKDSSVQLARLEVKLTLGLCEGAGMYRCHVVYINTRDRKVTSHPPASVNLTFSDLPGPMIMTLEPDTLVVPMASEIKLTCSGSSAVGLEPPDVGIAWQWAAVDSDPLGSTAWSLLNFTTFFPSPWDDVSETTVTAEPEGGEACKAATIRSTVVRTVTETDLYRTYRCYPTVVLRGGGGGDGGGGTGEGGSGGGGGVLRHLVRQAASVRVITELPELELTIHPDRLRFLGERITQFYLPLQFSCYEHDRPMDRVSRVRIQLLHGKKVMASVEGGQVPHGDSSSSSSNNYSVKSEASSQNATTVDNNQNDKIITNDSNENGNNNTNRSENLSKGRSKALESRDEFSRVDSRDRYGGWAEDVEARELGEDWSQDVAYNTDVQSDQLLFLTLTTYTVSCHSAGLYRCLFSYTLPVPGARPVLVTQVRSVNLPVDVAPQRPNMAVKEEQPNYSVETETELQCEAFIGGPTLTAKWVWEGCRQGICSPLVTLPDCPTCLDESAITKWPAEFNESICQYRQTTQVVYKFQVWDVFGLEIKCYVIKGGVSYPPAVRKFFVEDDAYTYQREGIRYESKRRHKKGYFNYLVFGVIPGMLFLGFLIYLVIGLDISRQRYQRIQRRLHRSTVFRSTQNRTDHFRKNRSSSGSALSTSARAKSSRPGRVDLIKSFCRTAVFALQDKTETETEEAERKIHQQQPPRQRPPKRSRTPLAYYRAAYPRVQFNCGQTASAPALSDIVVPSLSGTFASPNTQL